MAVQLNHHIILASDPDASARFLADILGLDPPVPYGPFMAVETANGVGLDYMRTDTEIIPNHYAFIVTEDEFDQILGRIRTRADIYADPHGHQPGEINHHDGGRGVYWADPDGHWLEIITRPVRQRQRNRRRRQRGLRLANATIVSNSASVSGSTERRLPLASRRHSASSGIVRSSSSETNGSARTGATVTQSQRGSSGLLAGS